MKFALSIVAIALSYAVWRWTAMVLDPLGLSEFLFVGRAVLIVAVLTATEFAFHKVAP